MRVWRHLADCELFAQGYAITIGNFDGIHRGHQMLIQQLLQKAKQLGLASLVILFEPQSNEFFMGAKAPARLTRLSEKLCLLRQLGVEHCLCLAFNQAFSLITAQQFIANLLVRALNVKYLMVGDDFRFGHMRLGNFSLLQQAAQRYDFKLIYAPTFSIANVRVSSSRIRHLLHQGNLASAAELLGRDYAYHGMVNRDRQLGRMLGVPTANLFLPQFPLVLHGVYAGVAQTSDGQYWQAAINIGLRPTIDGTRPLLEAHLLDFTGNLYGHFLQVWPCCQLRLEQRFSDLQVLRNQLQRDIAMTREYLVVWQATRLKTSAVFPLPLAMAPLASPSAV